ncbi:hypothetical protein [Paracoccus saliphilus]|uniref:Acetyl-CoA carboxylase biotin carboxyl carrier protein n=1 Tax=Paracoccus saliphilus TaxID=405559 RepID=A0AA45W7U4_9RHOB|nr:hypothetical protein [Paracoccus saliphilus]WCR01577.1 hypothetical protein JHX88_11575 [Paracoccus saliphilus]SIT12250.1 hypothetical protein SAMN05421772_12111 [Paracoccus saliphilus]
MFDQKELEQLVGAMRENGITTLEVDTGEDRLRLVLPPTPVRPAAMEEPHIATVAAKSPAIGIFLPRGGDDGLTELASGAAVSEGELLGYVSQGAVRVPVTSPSAGRLVGEAPEEGAILGHGDIAFVLEIRQ